MRREWRERFPPPPRFSVPDMHHGTCVTQVPWCMPGSLTSGFLWSWWRGKCSRHSRRMRNPRFCVSGKRPMGFAGLLKRLTSPYTAYNLDITTLKFSHVNELYISQSYLYDILCGIFEIYPKYLTHVSDDIIFYPKLNFLPCHYCDRRQDHLCSWASFNGPLYQIRKISGCACFGNAGNIFLATDVNGNR